MYYVNATTYTIQEYKLLSKVTLESKIKNAHIFTLIKQNQCNLDLYKYNFWVYFAHKTQLLRSSGKKYNVS